MLSSPVNIKKQVETDYLKPRKFNPNILTVTQRNRDLLLPYKIP